MKMSIKILQGNCLETLSSLEEKSVNTCVTSPPYWGLRDYGNDDQLGLEETPADFIAKLVAVFREVKRVLRDDGTLWLNLGDSYANSGTGKSSTKRGFNERYFGKEFAHDKQGVDEGHVDRSGLLFDVKTKDLVGIPWRVAFALQADGWYLRQDIIWSKPNPMPESVTDRCTKAHEYIFLLSKSPKYYYDNEAIKEDSAESSKDRLNQDIKNQKGSSRVPGKTNGTMNAVGGEKRNKRSVWVVATQSYSEAHFATYPPELIKPCILAGCPEGGTVLDPFGGSGTTAQVASNLNRNAILCELNPEYVEIAKGRLHDSLGMFLDMTVETPQH
jgi:DNA modification methylase